MSTRVTVMSFQPPTGPPIEHYVSANVVRHHLGDISRHTLGRYIQRGMPCHPTRSGRYLFKLSEVDAWVFEFGCTATPADETPDDDLDSQVVVA